MTLAELRRECPEIARLIDGARRKRHGGANAIESFGDLKLQLREMVQQFGDQSDEAFRLAQSAIVDSLIERCSPHFVVRARCLR